MTGCGLAGFDLGKCIGGSLTGWMPDWLLPLLPYWWVATLIAGAGIAYRLAGAPGLAAFAAAVGFILGRRSVSTEAQFPHPDSKPVPVKPKKKGLWK